MLLFTIPHTYINVNLSDIIYINRLVGHLKLIMYMLWVACELEYDHNLSSAHILTSVIQQHLFHNVR